MAGKTGYSQAQTSRPAQCKDEALTLTRYDLATGSLVFARQTFPTTNPLVSEHNFPVDFFGF